MTKNRRIKVNGIRRVDPDLRKLSRALIELAAAQAEADAEAAHRSLSSASPRAAPRISKGGRKGGSR